MTRRASNAERIARYRERRIPTEGMDGLAFLCGVAVAMSYVTLAVKALGPGHLLRLLETLILLAATMTQASDRLQRCVGDRKRAVVARRLVRRFGPATAAAFAALTGTSLVLDIAAGRDWRFGTAAFACALPPLFVTLRNALGGGRKGRSENFRAKHGQVR